MSDGALQSLMDEPDYEAFCQAELADPYDLLDRLRSVAPVHWSPLLDAWVVTSYDDVTTALRDERLRSDRAGINERGIPDDLRPGYQSLINHISNWLGFTDPPKHSRLRELSRAMLNPTLARAFRPWITSFVHETISEIEREEHVDLLDRLALRLPLALIGEALGMPETSMDRFHTLTCDVGPFAGRMNPSWDLEAQQSVDRANESWFALEDMFRQLIREKQRAPADDLLTRLVSSSQDGVISDDELIGLSVFFLAAGHGTARDLLASGLYLLMTHPDQAAKVATSPALVASAVEEVLRYESPIPTMSRLAADDLTLREMKIRSGETVLLHLAAANRDPAKFERAGTFDVTRSPNRHLAFGWGAHFCLGAPLAREQASVVIAEMAR
ncbi:MAG: cytochrome, partial [Acidimicrobiaceae bacterium]|nr:cytochrome [Acidimicrobiaceae bacterium]